jgi:hypothetical protein
VSKVMVYVWFDIEDYVTKESHELPLRAFEILRKYQVPVTCKIVAEKARSLVENGREDVLQAISESDVGYHLDTHSRHPTLYEYLTDLEVRSGSKEFLAREHDGFEFVKQTFSRQPSCFGHPGPTWAPHVYPALSEMQIPIYLDETPIVNLNGQPYWYCGMLNLNGANENFIVFDYSFERPDGVKKLKRKFAAIHKKLQLTGGAVSLLWHLHTAINKKFWDEVNFGRGMNRSKEEYQRPQAQPAEVTERAWRDFEELIRFMRSFSDVEFITASDAAKNYSHAAKQTVTRGEITEIAAHFSMSPDYLENGELIVSPAEAFGIVSKVLGSHEGSSNGSQSCEIRNCLGPSSPFTSRGTRSVTSQDLMAAARTASACIDEDQEIPSRIEVGTYAQLSPQDFLRAGSKVLYLVLRRKKVPSKLKITRSKPPNVKYVSTTNFAAACRWRVLPPRFKAPKILEQIHLQAWTLKPAKLLA